MRIGGKKDGRKYKVGIKRNYFQVRNLCMQGIREGGVSANTTYYVFTHGKDGAFEAFPIHDWYNFTPMMRCIVVYCTFVYCFVLGTSLIKTLL